MPAKRLKQAKTARKPSFLGAFFGHVFRGLAIAALAGGLGAASAYTVLSAAPAFTARLVGASFCPPAATATIVTVYDVQFHDWNQQLRQVPLPQLRCAGAEGLPVAATDRDFGAAWYGTFAAGTGGMTALLYFMWTVASSLALRPAGDSAYVGDAGMAAEDLPALFLEECCEVAPKQRTPAAQLYAAYAAWSRAKGHRPPASKALAQDWVRLGLRPKRFIGYSAWRGVGLKGQA